MTTLSAGVERTCAEEVHHADALESTEQGRRETGGSLMFIGLAVWVAGLLVVFFLPSGIKMGRETMFFSVIAALGMLGLLLTILGYMMRGHPDQ